MRRIARLPHAARDDARLGRNVQPAQRGDGSSFRREAEYACDSGAALCRRNAFWSDKFYGSPRDLSCGPGFLCALLAWSRGGDGLAAASWFETTLTATPALPRAVLQLCRALPALCLTPARPPALRQAPSPALFLRARGRERNWRC